MGKGSKMGKGHKASAPAKSPWNTPIIQKEK